MLGGSITDSKNITPTRKLSFLDMKSQPYWQKSPFLFPSLPFPSLSLPFLLLSSSSPLFFSFLFCHWHSQAEDEDNSFTLTSETNMATILNLSPGKIYVFQVRARTAVGYGPYSGKMYFQTLMGGKCYHFVFLSASAYLLFVCHSFY